MSSSLGPQADLERQIKDLVEQLKDSEVEGWQQGYEERIEQLAQVRARYEQRAAALDGVRETVSRLGEVTAPEQILAAAPEALCSSHDFDRALLSVVREGRMIPRAAFFRDDPDGAVRIIGELEAEPPRLEHPLIETEALRRRRATIVTEAAIHPRVHPDMARIMGWESFVTAPVALNEVVAVLHADRVSGPALDVLDGDVLWEFAAGLAETYVSAALRRSLRSQRAEMRSFVEWLGARSVELDEASAELTEEQRPLPPPPGQLGAVASAPRVDDRAVFEELLTRRELDVLRLLARGESNRGIAAALVISPGTVKFHVSNILNKLHVSNRAEAVSRYHRLVEVGDRGRAGPLNASD